MKVSHKSEMALNNIRCALIWCFSLVYFMGFSAVYITRINGANRLFINKFEIRCSSEMKDQNESHNENKNKMNFKMSER